MSSSRAILCDNSAINNNTKNKKHIIKSMLQEKLKELHINKNRSKRMRMAVKKRKVQSKKKIKQNVNKDVEIHKNESEYENDNIPLTIRLRTESEPLPEISSCNWNKFKTEVQEKETPLNNPKLKKCLNRMHGYKMFDLHFTALHFIRKAIVDSLLSRKWDNLVKLLVMLIENYSNPVFTVWIRHLCEILKQYHPRIRDTDLENQIDLIIEKYGSKENGQSNINVV